MSHLTIQDRHKIENLLDNNKTPTEIAELLGRNHSTIIRELKKHRYEDLENTKRNKNFCSYKSKCIQNNLCKIPPEKCTRHCKSCKIINCNKYCSRFVEDICEKLKRSPYVCNGC